MSDSAYDFIKQAMDEGHVGPRSRWKGDPADWPDQFRQEIRAIVESSAAWREGVQEVEGEGRSGVAHIKVDGTGSLTHFRLSSVKDVEQANTDIAEALALAMEQRAKQLAEIRPQEQGDER